MLPVVSCLKTPMLYMKDQSNKCKYKWRPRDMGMIYFPANPYYHLRIHFTLIFLTQTEQ